MTYPGGVRNRTTYVHRLADQVRTAQKKLALLARNAHGCKCVWQASWMALMADNLEEIAKSLERDADANRSKVGRKPRNVW